MGSERFLLRKCPLPWGMSLIAVARKESGELHVEHQ